jgi:hypothetical protein
MSDSVVEFVLKESQRHQSIDVEKRPHEDHISCKPTGLPL